MTRRCRKGVFKCAEGRKDDRADGENDVANASNCDQEDRNDCEKSRDVSANDRAEGASNRTRVLADRAGSVSNSTGLEVELELT